MSKRHKLKLKNFYAKKERKMSANLEDTIMRAVTIFFKRFRCPKKPHKEG